jgi:spore coat protein CotH
MSQEMGSGVRVARAGVWGLVGWLAGLGCQSGELASGPRPQGRETQELVDEETPGGSEANGPQHLPDDMAPEPDEDTGAAPDVPDLGDYTAFFDMFTVQDIHLTMSNDTIDELNGGTEVYQPATFEHDGATLEVGVRLKGSSTYQDFTGKPAFRLKFNEFVPGQRYADVKRIALNNLTGDPAQGREVVAYWVWRSGGMPVPQAALARVWVNEEYFGLYALIEGMDQEWLERHYDIATGDLWAGNNDADFTPAGVANFELQTSEGIAPLSLEDVADALDADDADFYTVASRVVDMEQFLDYIGFSAATGGSDGYPWHLNDFFVYGDPAEGGRLNFSPWGQDESWSDTWQWYGGSGILGERCDAEPDCAARIVAHTSAALGVYESLDVSGTMEQLFELSSDATAEDTRKPFTQVEVDTARAWLVEWMRDWPSHVRSEMHL